MASVTESRISHLTQVSLQMLRQHQDAMTVVQTAVHVVVTVVLAETTTRSNFLYGNLTILVPLPSGNGTFVYAKAGATGR